MCSRKETVLGFFSPDPGVDRSPQGSITLWILSILKSSESEALYGNKQPELPIYEWNVLVNPLASLASGKIQYAVVSRRIMTHGIDAAVQLENSEKGCSRSRRAIVVKLEFFSLSVSPLKLHTSYLIPP